MKTSHKSDELNNLKKGGVHKSGTYVMGPRGANRNYTYSKITHINSQEGKSWWLIEHDIQACYKYIKYIIKKTTDIIISSKRWLALAMKQKCSTGVKQQPIVPI